MKHCILLIVALFVIAITNGQTIPVDTTVATDNLKSSAEKMAKLFVAKNYPEYVKYIHPKVMTMAGGHDKMITLIKTSLKQMEDQGLIIRDLTIGDSMKIIITKTELQSVITEILEIKTQVGRLEANSYLIATSANKGKTWYFIDTGDKTLAELKTQFPSLSNRLIIPEKKTPVFFHD
jgi:hypothetical protein